MRRATCTYSNDFDLKNKTLSINKNLVRVKGRAIIGKPKTPKSIRQIALPDFLILMFKEYINLFYDIKPDRLMFPWGSQHIINKLK